ncbi:MAG: hypothetical protein HY927_04860 [Elusimicrobia bacterium]|nr:hypothetical protein [Elusimicrobiota bacterium]
MTRVIRTALAVLLACQGAAPAWAGPRIVVPEAGGTARPFPGSPVPALRLGLPSSQGLLPSVSLSAPGLGAVPAAPSLRQPVSWPALPSLSPVSLVAAPVPAVPPPAASPVDTLKAMEAAGLPFSSPDAALDHERAAAAMDAAFSGAVEAPDVVAQPSGPDPVGGLVRAGLGRGEALGVVARVRERAGRLAAALREGGTARSAALVKNAFLLTVLLGVRPGAMLFLPADQLAEVEAVARLANPRVRVATRPWGKAGEGVQAYIYDPDLALEAMRAATDAGLPEVSFAEDLAWIGTGPHAPRRARRWLDGRVRRYLDDHSEHRLGVLFGYPPNDVAALVRDDASGALGAGQDMVAAYYPGDESNGVFWLSKDPDHPVTRRTVAVYQAALDAAASAFGDL